MTKFADTAKSHLDKTSHLGTMFLNDHGSYRAMERYFKDAFSGIHTV